jgi:uroporphyrinogen-III synthase
MSPLADKRILITRAAAPSDALVTLLCERGAEPLLYPCIAIAPLSDTDALDRALMAAASGGYDWLVLTSANSVEVLAGRLTALGCAPALLSGLRVAAVGMATAKAALIHLGMTVSVLPERYRSYELAEAIQTPLGARVLLPQADLAPPDLAIALRSRGARVTTVTAYMTVAAQGGISLRAALESGIDAITFASGSAARGFVARMATEGILLDDLRSIAVACIGPSTSAAAEALGFHVAIVPPVYTLPALVGSLEDYFHV